MREARTCSVPGCSTCARLRAAAIDVAIARGIHEATGPAIVAQAGLSPGEAAAHYASADECLADAYDDGFELLVSVCLPALTADGPWQDRLLAACDAAIAEFSHRPKLARFCMVEAWHTQLPRLSEHRMAARQRAIDLLVEHRRPDDLSAALPALRFELFAGAAHHAVGNELQDPACNPRTVRDRFDQLVGMFEPSAPATLA
jgi:AcrR family transcriptional regulator